MNDNQAPPKEDEKIFYFKLPYIGQYSKYVQKKISILSKTLCHNTNITLIFTSLKVSSFFSLKDKIPNSLRSRVVYKFTCNSCNAIYVGQTSRYFDARVKEHLHKKSQPSTVYKHLNDNGACKNSCNESCFEIIDHDSSSYRLQIKESLHNEWLKPNLNKQKQLLNIGILV